MVRVSKPSQNLNMTNALKIAALALAIAACSPAPPSPRPLQIFLEISGPVQVAAGSEEPFWTQATAMLLERYEQGHCGDYHPILEYNTLFTASCDMTVSEFTAKLRTLPAASWQIRQISESEYDAAVARNRGQIPSPN